MSNHQITDQGIERHLSRSRIKSIAASKSMLMKLEREARLALIDKKMRDLQEMFESTSHERLKAMLANELKKLGEARGRIDP
jgi:hypothetical protein